MFVGPDRRDGDATSHPSKDAIINYKAKSAEYKRRVFDAKYGDLMPGTYRSTFPPSKTPDYTLWTIGYHYADWSPSDFAYIADDMFLYIQNKYGQNKRFTYMLNIAPANHLIPNKYASDRATRTVLNAYLKNIDIISRAKEYIGSVRIAE